MPARRLYSIPDRPCAPTAIARSRSLLFHVKHSHASTASSLLLLAWQQRTNLIASSTEPTLWTRHIADSLQLLALAPEAPHPGSISAPAAGFPGLGDRLRAGRRSRARTSTGRKQRQEGSLSARGGARDRRPGDGPRGADRGFRRARFHELVDVVTARALAPLAELLAIAYPLLKRGAAGSVPKGQDVDLN